MLGLLLFDFVLVFLVVFELEQEEDVLFGLFFEDIRAEFCEDVFFWFGFEFGFGFLLWFGFLFVIVSFLLFFVVLLFKTYEL